MVSNHPLVGTSSPGPGVKGQSDIGDGVLGEGENGVHGEAAANGAGVWGQNAGGGYGVRGSTNSGYVAGDGGTAGVWGHNAGSGIGLKGTSAGGDAVLGYSKAPNHAGVSAVNDSGGYGVWARGTPGGHFEGDAGAVGVYAQGGSSSAGDQSSSNSAGVLGVGGPPATQRDNGGPGVIGLGGGGDPLQFVVGSPGVYGQGGPGSAGVSARGGPYGGPGVFTEANAAGPPEAAAIWAIQRNADGFAGLFEGKVSIGGNLGVSEDLNCGHFSAAGYNADDIAGKFYGSVYIEGNLNVGGAKSAIVPFPDGTRRRLYCMESPENWFEDFGTGRLVNGQAQVQLEPGFASVAAADDYHVFLTEYEDNNGLYVTGRTSTGFGVRAKTSPAVGGTFSYRVVAKRKDIVAPRFDRVVLPQAPIADRALPRHHRRYRHG
jgi:hypothetical protein